MALYRCGSSEYALTTARTVYSTSNNNAPTGNLTISEGISSYKYIIATTIQGTQNNYANGEVGIIVSVEDFITTPISQTRGGQTCTATYIDDNTISFVGSENRDWVFFLVG